MVRCIPGCEDVFFVCFFFARALELIGSVAEEILPHESHFDEMRVGERRERRRLRWEHGIDRWEREPTWEEHPEFCVPLIRAGINRGIKNNV